MEPQNGICCILVLLVSSEQITATKNNNSSLSVLILTSIYPAHFFPLLALGEDLVSRGHNVTMLGPVMEGYEVLPIDAENKGITFMSAGFEPRSTYDTQKQGAKHEGASFFSLIYNMTKSIRDVNIEEFYMLRMIRLLKQINHRAYDYIISDNAVACVIIDLLDQWNTDRVMAVLAPIPLHPPGLITWPYPKMTTPFTENMTFIDRLLNTAVYTPLEYAALMLVEAIMQFYFNISMNGAFDSFLGVKYPILYNTLVGFDWARTTLPLQHYVGPMITRSPPPLDSSITDWLKDKPTKSIIYVSMGTSVDVTHEIALAVLSLASDHFVVWSCRNDLKEYTINEEKIYLTSWTSQIALLNHSSILYSVMQCGLTSVQESLYFGIPVICIPSAFDQYDVSLRLVSNGLGARLLPANINKEALTEAIQYVSSETVKDKVTKMRKIMIANDGVKKASNLVELYADIGHSHGIPSYAKYNWYWYEFYNIDVYIILVLLIMFGVWIIKRTCSTCCRLSQARVRPRLTTVDCVEEITTR